MHWLLVEPLRTFNTYERKRNACSKHGQFLWVRKVTGTLALEMQSYQPRKTEIQVSRTAHNERNHALTPGADRERYGGETRVDVWDRLPLNRKFAHDVQRSHSAGGEAVRCSKRLCVIARAPPWLRACRQNWYRKPIGLDLPSPAEPRELLKRRSCICDHLDLLPMKPACATGGSCFVFPNSGCPAFSADLLYRWVRIAGITPLRQTSTRRDLEKRRQAQGAMLRTTSQLGFRGLSVSWYVFCGLRYECSRLHEFGSERQSEPSPGDEFG